MNINNKTTNYKFMQTIHKMLRYAMLSWLALSFTLVNAQNWAYDKQYTWTDANGVSH